MAMRIMKKGDMNAHSGYVELYIDYRTEISDLPISPEVAWGATCFCIEDSSVWILSGDGMTWKELV